MRYFLRLVFVAYDFSALYLAFYLGWLTRFSLLPKLNIGMVHSSQPFALYWQLLLPSAIVLLFLTIREGLFRFGHDDTRRQFYGSIKAVVALCFIVLAYLVVFRLNFEFSRLGTLFALAWLMFLLPVGRALLVNLAHSRGGLAVPTLIIGEPDRVKAFVQAAGGDSYLKRTLILAQVTTEDLLNESGDDFTESARTRIDGLLSTQGLDKVVVFMQGVSRHHLTTILRCFEIRVRTIKLVPDASSMALVGAEIFRYGSTPLLALGQRVWSPWGLFLKRSFDMIITAPVLPIVALLVLVCAPFLGFKPLRRISRLGLSGQPLSLWQLRVDLEGKSFLFQSGLYKLPEVLGVFLGRQSLVGPAPLIQRELLVYSELQQSLGRVRPGLTGLWQVSDYGYFEEHQRISLDLYYAMNWSLALDLRILAESLFKGLRSLGHPRQGGWRT
jgi:lipopolysaccharide/colanic/teichoic acid biosynthesis glycosyltransferase